MNPELPRNPREEIELRVTALLLGELSEVEAAAVLEALAKDPELAKLHDDLKATIQLVQSAATHETEFTNVETVQPRLSEARRKKLLTAFVIPPLKSKDRKPKPVFRLGLVELAAVLAILVALAAMFLPALQVAKSRSQLARSGLEPELLSRRSWFSEGRTTPTPDSTGQPQSANGVATAAESAISRYAADSAVERAQAEIVAQTLSDDAGKTVTVAGRPEVMFSNSLRQEQRRLATAESLPAAPPVEPTKSRAAIVLPSFADADGDKAAVGESVQRSQETTLAFSVSQPQSMAAGDTVVNGRFYRFSGGGAGGGGAGSAVAQGGAATFDVEGRVPALGDVPTLGKAFRESETLKRDGAVLSDNFATSDFAVVPDSSVAKPQAWYDAKTTRGEKIDSLAMVDPATGLPSLKLQEELQLGRAVAPSGAVAAEPAMRGAVVAGVEVARADSLGVNAGQFGAFAPQAQSLGFKEAVSGPPAQQPAPSYGSVLSPTPTAPAVIGAEDALMERYGIAAGEVKKGAAAQPADPARQLNESLADGLRSERGRQMVQDGRLLLEAGRSAEAEARLKSALEADPENQAAHYYLSLANEAKYREANRAQERASKDAVVKLELDTTQSMAQQDSGKQLETRRFRVDKEALRQGIQSVSDAGGAVVQGDSAAGVPRVYVAGGNTGGVSGGAGQGDRGGIRMLTRTNSADELQRGVRQFFSTAGVDLNANGRTVFYNDRAGELFVRGTKEDLDVVGEITQALAVKQPEVRADTPLPRKAATNAPIPQPEIQTSENAFSTFSLNVSDVSFKLAMASLEQGQMPDAALVRSEEFINAFDYRDPEPAAGAPIAFAWERSRYPFAHNRDLLRFSLKTAAAGRQAGRPLNVVLLLDNSGSMERADRVQIIREALRVLAAQLQPHDKLSVVTFARTPRLVADGITGDKAGEVTEAVGELTPQGGTNLEEAMNLAYATAAKHYVASGINRVVVLTDGAANLGNVEPESLKQQVEAQRKQGIALDCFGIGWEGFNDDLLEVLSRNGDGRYGFINSPEEAATEFAGQLAGALKVAASDVKVQVEFNPKRVTSYRQIGYAKHQLTKEQFRDNTVDAAEIAAQEAGNALYTVEVNPAGEGPLATVRVRYKIPGTTDYREQAWDVPYSGAVAALEHSSPAMRLAASASAFAEWLVTSPFAGEVTPDRLLGYLGGVPEVYGVDERPKKLEWMIRQAKSIEGK